MLAAYVIEGKDCSFGVKLPEGVAQGQQIGNAAVNLV
jgi:hypothetical protein